MKENKDRCAASSVFIAAALLLAALTFVEVARYWTGPARADDVLAHASALVEPDPNVLQSHLEKTKETAEALKQKNPFVKKPPKEHPVKQVDGLLGDEILIGDKKYKVGDKIGDAKVISIEPTEVIIEWEGKTKSFAPLGAATSGRSEPSRKPEPSPARAVGAAKPTARPEIVEEVQVEAVFEEEDPFAWLGVDLSPRLRAMLLEKWNSASDEEKEEAREEWNRMSEEQKQQAIEQMERI